MSFYPELPVPAHSTVWSRQAFSAHLQIGDTYSHLSEILAQDDLDVLHLQTLRDSFETTTMPLHFSLCGQLDQSYPSHIEWIQQSTRRLARLSRALGIAIQARSGCVDMILAGSTCTDIVEVERRRDHTMFSTLSPLSGQESGDDLAKSSMRHGSVRRLLVIARSLYRMSLQHLT